MFEPIKQIISEFLIYLDARSKKGFEKQVVGVQVYNTQVGNQGAYCALKDLQERIKELEIDQIHA